MRSIVNPVSPKDSVDKITALSATLPEESLASLYNYFFEQSNSYEILLYLLKQIDKLKAPSSRPLLIDCLIMKAKLAEKLKLN